MRWICRPTRAWSGSCSTAAIQTFCVSWRNPTVENRDWGLDTYVAALDQAVDAVRDITGSDDIIDDGILLRRHHLRRLPCDAWVARKIKNLVLAVCLLDTDAATDSAFGSLITPETMTAAKEASRLRGVLDGQDLARMFAWMRPNDLIWNYWVNNYLLGNAPPAFDILYWNADTTRLPARLHGDYIDLYFTNPFVNAGKLTLERADASTWASVKGKVDSYVVAGAHRPHHAVEGGVQDRAHPGRRDDLRPVEQRTSAEPSQSADQQEGVLHDRRGRPGRTRTRSSRARRSGRAAGGSIGATGCSQRSGEEVEAPASLGDARHPVLMPSPGSYVFER